MENCMRGACIAKERHHTKTPRHFLQNSNHPQVFRKEVSVILSTFQLSRWSKKVFYPAILLCESESFRLSACKR